MGAPDAAAPVEARTAAFRGREAWDVAIVVNGVTFPITDEERAVVSLALVEYVADHAQDRVRRGCAKKLIYFLQTGRWPSDWEPLRRWRRAALRRAGLRAPKVPAPQPRVTCSTATATVE